MRGRVHFVVKLRGARPRFAKKSCLSPASRRILCRGPVARNADLSAVSQVYNLQPLAQFARPGCVQRYADCKSAIRQIENLRYDTWATFWSFPYLAPWQDASSTFRPRDCAVASRQDFVHHPTGDICQPEVASA